LAGRTRLADCELFCSYNISGYCNWNMRRGRACYFNSRGMSYLSSIDESIRSPAHRRYNIEIPLLSTGQDKKSVVCCLGRICPLNVSSNYPLHKIHLLTVAVTVVSITQANTVYYHLSYRFLGILIGKKITDHYSCGRPIRYLCTWGTRFKHSASSG
jgi:hypothetical protein